MNIESEALDASIQHWKDNIAADTPDNVSVSGSACALCDLHFYPVDDGTFRCTGCPVSQKTGYSQCRNTPWSHCETWLGEWNHYHKAVQMYGASKVVKTHVVKRDDARDNFRKHAKQMLEFLEGLRT